MVPAVVGVALAWATPAGAFKLVPIEAELEPSGRGATHTFRLENDAQEPAAIEIRVLSRSMDASGREVLEDAEDLFTIFPLQAVVMPGKTQALRVQWIGDAKPERELAFRLVAEQLPIDIGQAPQQGGQMRLLVRYVASLYVVPPGAAPDIGTDGATVRQGERGPELEVVVKNAGTAHAILRDATLRVEGRTPAGAPLVLDLATAQLGGLAGENVLAGASRRFVVPLPQPLAPGPVSVALDANLR